MKKKVVILHPCRFTRKGLKHMLPVAYQVISLKSLLPCQAVLTNEPPVNLLILALQGEGYTVLDALALINRLLRDKRTSPCQIRVLLDPHRSPCLSRYLEQLSPQVSIVPPWSALPLLRVQLTDGLSGTASRTTPAVIEHERCDSHGAAEHRIFNALLMGLNVKMIATMLSITTKTVSLHKRRGLMKLGVHSMASLVFLPPGKPTRRQGEPGVERGENQRQSRGLRSRDSSTRSVSTEQVWA